MNIQSNLRKLYNSIKNLQIEDKDLSPDNYGRAAYLAGMLDSAKIFIKLYNGELTEETLDREINSLKETPNA